jgi:4-carboxymuconolactone decarboxylase
MEGRLGGLAVSLAAFSLAVLTVQKGIAMAKASTKATAAKKPAARKKAAAKGGMRPEFASEMFAKGLDMRRSVLGSAYVDASLQNVDPFMVDFQKLVTEYCWGDVWTRPGLDKRHPSMLNIAMLTALNRGNELKLHLRGALNNGVTRDEIKEILLQTCIYCGIPAGLDAFKHAMAVFKEVDGQ